MTALQVYRVRLRRLMRVATQVAEALDFLGFAFLAQLARGLFLAALLTALLLELVVRATLRLAVCTVRYVLTRTLQLLRAWGNVAVLLLALQVQVGLNRADTAHEFYSFIMKSPISCSTYTA